MHSTEQACDMQRIKDYLEDRLGEDELAEFEQHLGQCDHCRCELQQSAAEPQMWRDAVALLGSKVPDSPGDASSAVSQGSQGRKVLSVLDSLAPTDDPLMLGRIGEYEVSGVVGVGGMGAVLKGFDKSLRRVVAIKVMAPHLADCGSARLRFQREARAAAAITHDNVIDTYGVSEANGLPYLVMPFARGPSLQKRIDESGPLSAIEVVRIGRQIAAGLAAAHEQGLVHRDIKPANILLNEGIERLWITDFGVARAMDDASMTQTGLIAGTPQYMSPEQARGETVDHRSDLFSMGSILYTACTGRPPFRSEAAYGILRRITDTDPTPIREINPDVPQWLCHVIERLMAKHPADRFQGAEEVAELLEGCLAHLQQPTRMALPSCLTGPPVFGDTSRPQPRGQRAAHADVSRRRLRLRRIGIWGVAVAVSLAAIGFLAWQLTAPADVSGVWEGESWSNVELSSSPAAAGWYTGTFTDAAGRKGVLQLEWSRLQLRYNGRWRIGEGRAGSITLRVRDAGGIRGALAVDAGIPLDAAEPRLREFIWQTSPDGRHQRPLPNPAVEAQNDPHPSGAAPLKGTQHVAQNANSIATPLQPLSAAFGPAPELARRFRELRNQLRSEEKSLAHSQAGLVKAEKELSDYQAAIADDDKITPEKRRTLERTVQSQMKALKASRENVNNWQASITELKQEWEAAVVERDTVIAILKTQLEAAVDHHEAKQTLAEFAKRHFQLGEGQMHDIIEATQAATAAAATVRQLELLLEYYANLGSGLVGTNDEPVSPSEPHAAP